MKKTIHIEQKIQMKKKTISFWWGCLLVTLGSSVFLQAQDAVRKIGNNPLTIEETAALEVESTTKGFILPRMTETQREAITNPANGLMVFDTTTQLIYYYDLPSTSWKRLETALDFNLKSTFTTTYNFRVTINNKSKSSMTITFSTSDIKLSGVTGASITAVDDTSETILPQGSHTINYTVSYGSAPATDASLTLKAEYEYDFVTTSSTSNVSSFNGRFYGTVKTSTGKTWLDRNLGATQVATSLADAASYGDLYQWGRGTDGHQIRTSISVADGVTSSTPTPGHGYFIPNTNTPNDWIIPQNPSLWQGVNGINNPCPSGFRLPSETELEAERLAFTSNNAAGAFASPLKLAAAGLRSYTNSAIFSAGSAGYYWTSTVADSYQSRVFIMSSSVNFSSLVRAYGLSVRCIKD